MKGLWAANCVGRFSFMGSGIAPTRRGGDELNPAIAYHRRDQTTECDQAQPRARSLSTCSNAGVEVEGETDERGKLVVA